MIEHQIETAEAVTADEGLPVIVVNGRDGITPATVMELSRLLAGGTD